MFYPTSYVYKIGTNDESINTSETTSTNKKSDLSTTKKSKSPTTNLNTSLDSISNTNKIESALIKDFANNLLISVQRNNCLDLEKRSVISVFFPFLNSCFFSRPNEFCSIIDDSVHHQSCRCHQPLPNNTRLSPFIPFHRRPRTTTSDSSNRNKTEPVKVENPSGSIENHDMLTESTSSPMININTQPTTNEKSTEWIASTPNSVGITASPSIPASIPNLNSVASNSPVPNPPSSSRSLKRSATVAFEETVPENNESEQQKQTYDFYQTDSL